MTAQDWSIVDRRQVVRSAGLLAGATAALGLTGCTVIEDAETPEHQGVFLPSSEECARLKGRLEDILVRNIIPFWYPRSLDSKNGGFLLNHERSGKWLGSADKTLISQSRMAWFFARLSRSPYAEDGHLDAARHGLKFLAERLWDQEHGGFYWSVGPDGGASGLREKHLVAQAYGLLILTELHKATDDALAKDLADELFNLIEMKAHDNDYGGYFDSFTPEWAPPAKGTRNAMRTPVGVKTYLTHVHIMEALTAYHMSWPSALSAARMQELLAAQTVRFLDPRSGEGINRFHRDWSPTVKSGLIDPFYDHDLKAISIVVKCCQALGLQPLVLRPYFERMFDNAVERGFDRDRGGFYQPHTRAAHAKDKEWWTQAEALTGALNVFKLTGKEEHWAIFTRTLDWIEAVHVDGQGGEWHAIISSNGQPSGQKAWAWKAAFHTARSMFDSMELLHDLPNQEAKAELSEDGRDRCSDSA